MPGDDGSSEAPRLSSSFACGALLTVVALVSLAATQPMDHTWNLLPLGAARNDSQLELSNEEHLSRQHQSAGHRDADSTYNATWPKWRLSEDRMQTWRAFAADFKYPESEEAALQSVMVHPHTPQLCIELCGETVCADEMAARVDRTTQKNPVYRHTSCQGLARPLPFYYTIGYSQSGSTFFAGLLRAHPHISWACNKEIFYWDRTLNARARRSGYRGDEVFALDGYARCFRRVLKKGNEHNVVGDNTIKTIFTDIWFPLWVRAVNPQMKLMVLLRNPAKRSFSRYSMQGGGLHCAIYFPLNVCKRPGRYFTDFVTMALRHYRENCPDMTPTGDPSAVYRCTYMPGNALDQDPIMSSIQVLHIKHWLNFFPKEQFLFVPSDDLFTEPEKTARRVTDFLELEPFRDGAVQGVLNSLHKFSHTKKAAPPEPETMEVLTEFFRPYVDELRALMRSDFGIENLSMEH